MCPGRLENAYISGVGARRDKRRTLGNGNVTPPLHCQGVAHAEEFGGFGAGDTGVRAKAVEMVEPLTRRPRRQRRLTKLREALLEAIEHHAAKRIPRRHRATRTGIATLERNIPNLKAHHAAFIFAEQTVFPERRHSIDFQRRAKALPYIVDRKPRKPFAHTLQRSGRNNRGPVSDGVVRETARRITHDDLLLKEHAEPFRSVFVCGREVEGANRNLPAISRHGQCNTVKIRRIIGTNQVNRRCALAVHPTPIDGIQRPGAVQRQSSRRPDAPFRNTDRVERFDRVQTYVRKTRSGASSHTKILAEPTSEVPRVSARIERNSAKETAH